MGLAKVGDSSGDKHKEKSYVWGNVLAWIAPITLFLVFSSSFKGISETKATGLGAVDRGFGATGWIALCGSFVLGLVIPATAIVLLLRSPGATLPRGLLSVISIIISVLTIVLAYFILRIVIHV